MKQLGPLQDAAIQEWRRARASMPPLHVLCKEPSTPDAPDYELAPCKALGDAFDFVTVDDAPLRESFAIFAHACDEYAKAWLAAHAHAATYGSHALKLDNVREMSRTLRYPDRSTGTTGVKLIEHVRDAYVTLSRRIEALVG